MSDEITDGAAPVEPAAQHGVSRRKFLKETAGAAGIATVAYLWFDGYTATTYAEDFEPTRPGAARKTFSAQEWNTLAAACDRLLPSSPGSPGARDVNAIGYLDAVLQQGQVADSTRKIVKDGAAKLDARARAKGAKEFAALPPVQQDAAVRVFETFKAPDGTYPGHTWLKWMLQYVLEAFFGDPVHGGNPDEIAWTWAGHKPGFPRPEPHQKGWRPQERE